MANRHYTQDAFFTVRERTRGGGVKPNTFGLWAGHKAALIARYLQLFLRVTKHGTYIDGFAGPQVPDRPETWSAYRVITDQPWGNELPRLRHFHLVDAKVEQTQRLHELGRLRRDLDINIYRGNINRYIDALLRPEIIPPREATFCLLDQRMFECHWSTVERIAAYPKEGWKIEVFYLFAIAWIDRSLAKVGKAKAQAWWGNDGWWRLLDTTDPWQRAELVRRRFEDELGYGWATAWPIRDTELWRGRNRLMYFMIHATDHGRAPALMEQAYEQAVRPLPRVAQASLLDVEPAADPMFGRQATAHQT